MNLTISAAETDGVANDDTICSGGNISFTAAGAAGGTIQWLVDGIAPAGALTDPGNVALYPETGLVTGQVVSYRVTSAAGCVIPGPSITVTVLDAPVASITASQNIICGGVAGGVPYADSVTFTANDVPGANYQFFNGANPISPVQAVRTFTTNDFSIYDEDLQFNISVVVTNAAGCSDTDSVLIDLNYVTANSVEINGGRGVGINICNGATVAPALTFQTVAADPVTNPDGLDTDDFTDGANFPTGAALTFQWQNRVGGGAWTNITGATLENYSPPLLYQTTEYRRRSRSIFNGDPTVPCDDFSNIITITVAGALVGGEVQRDNGGVWVDQTEIICVDDTPQLLRVINDTAGPGVDYQWQYSLDNAVWEDITIANGYAADANGFQYQPDPITLADISSVHTLQIVAPLMATDGDFYRITIGADVFTVEVGEDNSSDITGGDGDVDSIVEVIEYLAFKINDLGAGITATQDGVDTITYTLAPGSVLSPVIRVDDGGVDVTAPANSVANQTYNAQGNTRFYRRSITQNFGGAILPLCQTFSDVHTVEVNTVIAGSIDNANPIICYNTQPSIFTSKRNAYSTVAGATITYQWYRTNDVARTNWIPIGGETNQDLTFTTALTQSTSFRREAISTFGLIQQFVKSTLQNLQLLFLMKLILEIY